MTGPSIGTKTHKSEKTKRKIINAYLDLIPMKKWDKISVKEISAQANITRGTFYQYFSDIFDLMEHIETTLMTDLKKRYSSIHKIEPTTFNPELFIKKFDYNPPEVFYSWFNFCIEHKKSITVLLDPKHGDTYFVKKLKVILTEYISKMMDADGMPRDNLRETFVKVFIELHFLSARAWLSSTDENPLLTTDEIINVLNTMRVGASYLSYRRLVCPDPNDKMKFPDGTDKNCC